MHKILLILGLLLRGPLYGYELHRIIRAHGALYADLKKANLYYLLTHLAEDGYLRVEAQSGARGVRGERLIYELTEQGRVRFYTLLRETLLSYEPVLTGIGTAVVFLSQLPAAEGLALLEERRKIVTTRRAQLPIEQADTMSPLVRVANDHIVSLIDAELAWIDRSLAYLRAIHWTNEAVSHTQSGTEEANDDH